MEYISSRDNKTVKQLKRLFESTKSRNKSSEFIVEGVKLVSEAILNKKLKQLIISENFLKFYKDSVLVKEKGEEIDRYIADEGKFLVVKDSIFDMLSDTVNTQGVMGVASMPQYGDVMEYLSDKKEIRLLVLEDIRDPGNLGTMLRTAEATGMTAVIMNKNTVDVYNPKVVRSTVGSIFRQPFFYMENLIETLEKLKTLEIKFFATSLEGSKDYRFVEYGKRAGFLIGNEARGLSKEIQNFSDERVYIPMRGQVESLNASIAAALMMYTII